MKRNKERFITVLYRGKKVFFSEKGAQTRKPKNIWNIVKLRENKLPRNFILVMQVIQYVQRKIDWLYFLKNVLLIFSFMDSILSQKGICIRWTRTNALVYVSESLYLPKFLRYFTINLQYVRFWVWKVRQVAFPFLCVWCSP